MNGDYEQVFFSTFPFSFFFAGFSSCVSTVIRGGGGRIMLLAVLLGSFPRGLVFSFFSRAFFLFGFPILGEL